METKDKLFFTVAVLSSFLLTFEWLLRFESSPSNPIIIISVMVLIGSIAIMLISLSSKLKELEDRMDAKDRALRINLQSTESNIGVKMDEFGSKVDNAVYEFNLRKYR